MMFFRVIKRYHLEVTKVEPSKDYDTNGRWIVTLKSTQTEAISREEFDGVMICIGHHVFPNIPTFPGQQKFKGTILHTHSVKSCERFSDQKVVVVGIGILELMLLLIAVSLPNKFI
ncbi:flavin-containing monooxygenase [Caerostris extrusa]|uniref:Flavin-containing monooxygenase n=1 Tax=Caerostris extrusa TaxID=172846 RepID=A0AAV4XSB2_CAEEX|nr:flavin-containing monooxygenase [Caerostris extrusa]